MKAHIQINCRSAPRARIIFADAIRSYSVIVIAWMILFTSPVFAADSRVCSLRTHYSRSSFQGL